MNILYIYGLDSKLSPGKKKVLEKYGRVLTPEVDYYTNTNSISTILKQMSNEKVDVVIGSSMGGFAGFYISTILGVPALLFNPALEKRSVEQLVPEAEVIEITDKKFLLGAIDDVIDPGDTLRFLAGCYNANSNFYIHIMPGLTHNIPVDIFSNEVKAFFKQFFPYLVSPHSHN